MRLRRFGLAFALIVGLGGVSSAAPATTAEPLAAESLALVDHAKWKGHKGHKGWKHGRGHAYGHYKHRRHHGYRGRGHRYGHYKQRRYYGNRGRHYGWHRGHHYGWGRGPRVHFRF